MTKLELVNYIQDYIYNTLDDMSWTAFLKTDGFFEGLKKEVKEGKK